MVCTDVQSDAVQFSAVQCCTVECTAYYYNAVQCSAVQCTAHTSVPLSANMSMAMSAMIRAQSLNLLVRLE